MPASLSELKEMSSMLVYSRARDCARDALVKGQHILGVGRHGCCCVCLRSAECKLGLHVTVSFRETDPTGIIELTEFYKTCAKSDFPGEKTIPRKAVTMGSVACMAHAGALNEHARCPSHSRSAEL